MQAERLTAVGTLAYGIAHEYNNILAGMLGNAEFGMGSDDPKEVKECFQIIMENCDRAKSITGSLLAFSRQRYGKRQRTDVTKVVETVLGLIERELEKQNIEVVRKFNPVPEITCDSGDLSEVFLNMITNARDAMTPQGGSLTIEIGKNKDDIEIVFTDTGCGIPDGIKSRIFEPFVTTKGALGQSEILGTGLGLFLSYGIIHRYRGTIDVTSKENKGSKFTIRIPISENQQSPTLIKAEEEKPAAVPENLNILLVDDEKPILSSIKKFLEAKGHSVVASPSGKKGLQLFKDKNFDLVLSDVTMPDMDGLQLISQIRSIDKQVKVIALTGHLEEEKLKSAENAGADKILIKPFKNEDLHKAIGEVFGT
jgi:two-component system NtrC family sensor kinase